MIADYTSLITNIISWTNHNDINTAVAGTLLNLGEKRVYREIKVTEMETTLSVTIAGGVATLPTDFEGLRHVRVGGSPDVPLEVLDAEELFHAYPTRSSDAKPKFCAVNGSTLEFGPYPDSTYTIKGMYYARPVSLSASNRTNYFSDEGGDALFFASLVNAEPFLKNDQRIAIWEGLYIRAKNEIMNEQKQKRLNGSPKMTRAR